MTWYNTPLEQKRRFTLGAKKMRLELLLIDAIGNSDRYSISFGWGYGSRMWLLKIKPRGFFSYFSSAPISALVPAVVSALPAYVEFRTDAYKSIAIQLRTGLEKLLDRHVTLMDNSKEVGYGYREKE